LIGSSSHMLFRLLNQKCRKELAGSFGVSQNA
jgi:hypothetical protein